MDVPFTHSDSSVLLGEHKRGKRGCVSRLAKIWLELIRNYIQSLYSVQLNITVGVVLICSDTDTDASPTFYIGGLLRLVALLRGV